VRRRDERVRGGAVRGAERGAGCGAAEEREMGNHY